ncbi:FAD/NAD(P)-binding domain-containing protein [Hypomontagnella submonticulosa]|nr:FAD/NAD(P)-binding domain-containing protein [Hypomontagnella submonticulosa]
MGSSRKHLEVVIVGGSLSGLMCGVALKHAGHTVTIIEKADDDRQSHMAGVCLGLDAQRFLARHDRFTEVFSHRSLRIQALKKDGTIQPFVNARREITSWDTYYFRLRALFDGYTSSFYPSPAPPIDTDGAVAYKSRHEVTDIRVTDEDDGSKVALAVLDHKTQDVSKMKADLVIGADGPDSIVRAKYLPDTRRQYVGYIAWRGTVPESEVSDATREVFKRSATVYMMHRHHCVTYTIPGKNGSLKPGERYINFLWYTNHTPDELDEIMIDGVDGHRHHNIVPSGRVREDIWKERIEEAKRIPLGAPFLDVITKIKQPFIQVITDFYSPRASFEDGKVLLIGDALSLFRPHTAFSGTQAAFHSLMVEDLIAGKMSLEKWEDKVLRFSYLHWLQSVWYGDFYQYQMAYALTSAFQFWTYCGIDKIKSWWTGEEALLRGVSLLVEEYDSP